MSFHKRVPATRFSDRISDKKWLCVQSYLISDISSDEKCCFDPFYLRTPQIAHQIFY